MLYIAGRELIIQKVEGRIGGEKIGRPVVILEGTCSLTDTSLVRSVILKGTCSLTNYFAGFEGDATVNKQVPQDDNKEKRKVKSSRKRRINLKKNACRGTPFFEAKQPTDAGNTVFGKKMKK